MLQLSLFGIASSLLQDYLILKNDKPAIEKETVIYFDQKLAILNLQSAVGELFPLAGGKISADRDRIC